MQRASTRADALLSHIKQRGKGPGHILTETERMFNNWVLPEYLRMVFDFQDDAQDRQKAEIRQQRSKTRKTDLEIAVTNVRVERERMLKNDEINVAQFEELELQDGRLPNGKPLESIFFIDEPIYTEILSFSSNPLDLLSNDAEKILNDISSQLTVAFELSATETRQKQSRQIREATAALHFLKEEYEEILLTQKMEEQQELEQQAAEAKINANPESERGIEKRPDDEDNLASENNPHEFTGKELTGKELTPVNLKQTLNKVRNRNADTPQQLILKGIEELVLENIPPTPQPIIKVEPVIEVHLPPQEEKQIIVNVEAPHTPPAPEVIVNIPKAPDITVEAPKVTVNPPDITINPPEVTVNNQSDSVKKGEDDEGEYEIIDIKRDTLGDIKRLIRRKKKDGK